MERERATPEEIDRLLLSHYSSEGWGGDAKGMPTSYAQIARSDDRSGNVIGLGLAAISGAIFGAFLLFPMLRGLLVAIQMFADAVQP